MKQKTISDEWLQSILVNEHAFISSNIRIAGEYLRSARSKKGDWGYSRGLPTDIHTSALAIEAIRMCKSAEFETSAEDATVCIREMATDIVDTFGVQQLVDLLNILWGSETKDTELVGEILTRLKALRNGAGWGGPEPSISLSCEVILAFLRFKEASEEIVQEWVDYLKEQQRVEDGGWGATPESASAIVPTSKGLSMLSRVGNVRMAKARSGAIRFLVGYLEDKGWEDISDNFALCTALRALGEVQEVSFKIVQSGIDCLNERVNSDGAWGAAKEEASDIEHTALAMIALCSSGENRFVPSRLARAALEAIYDETSRLQSERDRLLEDINERVQKEVKNVIKERNELQRKINKYKKELGRFEREKENYERKEGSLTDAIREMQEEIRYKSRREFVVPQLEYEQKVCLTPRFVPLKVAVNPITACVILAVSVGVVAGISYYFLPRNMWMFSGVIGGYIVVLIGWLYLSRLESIRSRRWYEMGFGPERSFIIHELVSLLAHWPPSTREEFIFRMVKIGERAGPVEFEEEIVHFCERYLPAEERRQVSRVLHILASLPPSGRLSIFDEIRNRTHVRED